MANGPVAYTVKSLLGPVLFVVAAFFYGRAAGREERHSKRRKDGRK